MRTSAALVLVLLAGSGSTLPRHVAAQTPNTPETLPTPARVHRLGSHRTFGAGIVAASIRQVWFDVTRPAYAIVLRFAPDGSIEALLPGTQGESNDRPPGRHTITATPPQLIAQPAAGSDTARLLDPVLRSADALIRGGRPVFPPAAGSNDSADAATTYYWLVIVADVATGREELRSSLETIMSRQAFSTVEAAARALPRRLVGDRARSWAAWYAVVRR